MLLRLSLLAGMIAVAGCRSADLSPSNEETPAGTVRVHPPDEITMGDDAGLGEPSVDIVDPIDGEVFVQDTLVAGEWTAPVTFQVSSAHVARVAIVADGEFDLGEADAAGMVTYSFYGEGPRAIAAIGYDGAGVEVARDEITITIEAPADESCHAMLDALGLDWEAASATRGIDDPVRVQALINGVTFNNGSGNPAAMLMDCELGVRLHALAGVLRAHGIDSLIHYGVYNYRCIGGGDPDSGTCTPSQHAYARAIDLHSFSGGGVTYSTETDFVITSSSECPMESFDDEDRVLKEIACALFAERIFQIILTPNYNADHRNHYHVDLSEGQMFLGVGVAGIDPGVPGMDY
jgi:hypothetical protein